jgi:hypothetical protein
MSRPETHGVDVTAEGGVDLERLRAIVAELEGDAVVSK